MSAGTALVVDDALALGDRVRLARLAAGLSRSELALRLGVSLGTYERIERGTRDLRLSELNALAAATGQDVAFFGASSPQDGAEERVLPPPLPAVNDEEGAE